MPPKRSSLSRSTSSARKQKASRASETDEQRNARLESDRVRHAEALSSETGQEHEARIEIHRMHNARVRSSETEERREARKETDRSAHRRTHHHADLNLGAFHCDANYDYQHHTSVVIGRMEELCVHCFALRFKNEPTGMCCLGGKMKLPELNSPPEPLSTLESGETSQSKHFLANVRKYNSCFQLTSFGATNIVHENYMSTFKVQGQIYHRAGSLLPPADNAEHKYLQIYFMGNTDEQIDQRCRLNTGTKREIVASLQTLFDQHELIRLFRTALERMPSDEFKVVLRADKTPVGQHERRYNASTIDEVAIVILGEEFNSRDIILHRRNGHVQRVAETHRSYDGLQYLILFWQGEDGYHFNVKQKNPCIRKHLSK